MRLAIRIQGVVSSYRRRSGRQKSVGREDGRERRCKTQRTRDFRRFSRAWTGRDPEETRADIVELSAEEASRGLAVGLATAEHRSLVGRLVYAGPVPGV